MFTFNGNHLENTSNTKLVEPNGQYWDLMEFIIDDLFKFSNMFAIVHCNFSLPLLTSVEILIYLIVPVFEGNGVLCFLGYVQE